MSLSLPTAPGQYDAANEAVTRRLIETADKMNLKTGGIVILQDTNGKWWKLVVSTSGVLSTTAA